MAGPLDTGPVDLGAITLGEIYRTLLRLEGKVDEVNRYAHDQTHRLSQDLTKAIGEVALQGRDVDLLHGHIRRIDRRVDKVYKNAATLASAVSGTVVTIAGLILTWFRKP